jgi:signal transduction histidine kinase
VLLDLQPDHVHLSVEDNGRGFDPERIDPSHLGLRSMRERADEAGAEFAVKPRPGGGTVVRLDWDRSADQE